MFIRFKRSDPSAVGWRGLARITIAKVTSVHHDKSLCEALWPAALSDLTLYPPNMLSAAARSASRSQRSLGTSAHLILAFQTSETLRLLDFSRSPVISLDQPESWMIHLAPKDTLMFVGSFHWKFAPWRPFLNFMT